jgi:hypothetical protein
MEFYRMKRLIGIALFLLTMMLSLPLAIAQEGGTGTNFFATNTPLANTSAPETTATPSAVTTEDAGEPVVLSSPEECAYVEGESTSDACIAFMQAHPEPQVSEILRDGTTLGLYSFWRVGPQAVNTYDTPNGNLVGQIPQGFNFVSVVNQTEGWLQAEDGVWINQADASFVSASNFVGVTLPEDWTCPLVGYWIQQGFMPAAIRVGLLIPRQVLCLCITNASISIPKYAMPKAGSGILSAPINGSSKYS